MNPAHPHKTKKPAQISRLPKSRGGGNNDKKINPSPSNIFTRINF
jgi:hypothetical protein